MRSKLSNQTLDKKRNRLWDNNTSILRIDAFCSSVPSNRPLAKRNPSWNIDNGTRRDVRPTLQWEVNWGVALRRILRSRDLKVRLIDEASLHLDRNVAYADMTAEKNLRGELRSEVDRSLSKDNIVIVDSLNNIKGYRYELWCLARAAGIKYCVIYCDTGEDDCRKWNKERGDKEEMMYADKVFDDLIRRFEKPDRRNRWDYPLFELFPSKDGIKESSVAIMDAVSYLTDKSTTKSRDLHVLQPTIATQNARISDANSLYEMDQATQEVINAIVEAQSSGLGGPLNGIDVGKGLPAITIERSVGLPELRRLRKTFIKLTAQTSLSGRPPPSDADSVKRMFVDYLNREIGAA